MIGPTAAPDTDFFNDPRVHFMRNALAHAPKGQREMVAAAIRTAFVQDDAPAASVQWRQIADSLRPRFAKLAELMDQAEADVLACKAHRSSRFAPQGPPHQDPLHG